MENQPVPASGRKLWLPIIPPMKLRLPSLLSLCLALPLGAAEYFVDSLNGSDDAPGTSESTAWRSLEKVNAADLQPGDTVRFIRGGLWRGALRAKSGAPGSPVTYTSYGSDKLPKPRLYGSKALNRPSDWTQAGPRLWRTVEPVSEPAEKTLADVGNLIFDGNRAAVKRWSRETLKADGDFWFEPETRRVWLVGEKNPAEVFREIEAALRRRPVVSLSRARHVVFSDFDVRYAGAHAFAGRDASHVIIRNCDISWSGGGHQFTRPDGVPVRFGNGVEFWEEASDNLVEGCRIWEIYDAALTNQGLRKTQQRNITYRDNLVWNCEYSFEYWHGGGEAVVDNIVVENNVFLNAGGGWGHSQRPDPNGRHLMFYETKAKTTNFVIRNNVFSRATNSILRVDSRRGMERTAEDSDASQKTGEEGVAWARQILMENNTWFQTPGDGRALVQWQTETINDFETYRAKTGLDKNSLWQP